MKRALLLAALATLLCLPGVPAQADQAPYPQDQAALDKEYAAFHWQDAAQDYALPNSHSRIHLPQGFSVLLGAEARRNVFLNNGIEFPATEAVLYDNDSGAEIDFEYIEEGYVKDDDWSDIDADDFIEQMKADQIASNDQRIANGQEAFEVIGWIEKPSYDAANHVAHYVVEMGNDQHHWVNAIAVKLGRSGYHQLTWLGDIETFHASGPKVLATALDSHAYDTDHRYADFKQGDKVAAYGIAGLVAAIAGVKLSKGLLAAVIGFIAIAGKKIAILAVPVLIGVGAVFKRFFGRKN